MANEIAAPADAPKVPAARAAWILLFLAWACFLVPLPGIGLFIGGPLNLVAFILAIDALSKGGVRSGLFQLVCSLLVSPIVYFVGWALMAALLATPAGGGVVAPAAT